MALTYLLLFMFVVTGIRVVHLSTNTTDLETTNDKIDSTFTECCQKLSIEIKEDQSAEMKIMLSKETVEEFEKTFDLCSAKERHALKSLVDDAIASKSTSSDGEQSCSRLVEVMHYLTDVFDVPEELQKRSSCLFSVILCDVSAEQLDTLKKIVQDCLEDFKSESDAQAKFSTRDAFEFFLYKLFIPAGVIALIGITVKFVLSRYR